MRLERKLLVVTGLPATGKTWLATEIATKLNIPLFTKDQIKIKMLEVFGKKDRKWDIKAGISAVSIQMDIARELLLRDIPVIVESNYRQEFDGPLIEALMKGTSAALLQIVCGANGELLIERYSKRAEQDKSRELLTQGIDAWRSTLIKGYAEPLNLPGQVIKVDTTDFSKLCLDDIIATAQKFIAK